MRISSRVVGAFILVGHASIAGATLIDGFEGGLSGWDFLGDVSLQGSSVGVASAGSQQAFITTLCDSRFASWCEVTNPEAPLSGVSSISSVDAASFLGFGIDAFGTSDLYHALPVAPEGDIRGESGVMRTRFYATAGSVLRFDWRHYAQGGLSGGGYEGDSSYFSVWGDGPGDMRVTDYLWHGFGYPAPSASNLAAIDLCSSVIDNNCEMSATYDTGYLTRTVHLPSDGWYWLGFGMFEGEEGTVPSALSLDNIRLTARAVPEPASGASFALGLLLLLGLARRQLRRRDSFR